MTVFWHRSKKTTKKNDEANCPSLCEPGTVCSWKSCCSLTSVKWLSALKLTFFLTLVNVDCYRVVVSVTPTVIQMRERTRRNVLKALIMIYCRLTSISPPPALLRFSRCQTLLFSCWEKLLISFQHSFAPFCIIYHGESCCLPWEISK